MVSAVFQGCLDVNQWEARQVAVLHCVLDTSVNGWDVFLRNTATGNSVFELVSCGLALFQLSWIWVVRLDGDDNLSELTRTTGLLLVGEVQGLNSLADGLAVSNLWVTNVRFDLVFALHAVNKNVQVQLAHAADNGLAGLFVQFNGEGWVLSSKLLNSGTQLLLVSLGLRLDGNLDNWIREVHGLEDDWVCTVGQGVTSGGVLQADDCVDVTSYCLFNRVFLVGVHLEQLTNAFLLALGGVLYFITWGDLARVNADEDQLTEEWVCSKLESQAGEWGVDGWLTNQFLILIADCVAVNLAHIEWVR